MKKLIEVVLLLLVMTSGAVTSSAQKLNSDLMVQSPTTSRRITSGPIAAETIGQKLRRLASIAAASNPLDNPIATGVTMTVTTAQDLTLTRTFTAPANPTSFAVHGGTPTLVSGIIWLFPVADSSPDIHGNCSFFLPNKGLNAWGWEVDFMTDAPKLQIWMYGYSGAASNFRILVDDHYVTLAPTTYPPAGGASFTTLDFGGVRQPRRIKYRGMLNNEFAGVLTTYADSVWAPDESDTILAAFTGDSYTNHMGSVPGGGTEPDGTWPNIVGNYLGWGDIRQVALGGTGYINNATYSLGGTTYNSVPIIQQIPRWSGLNPDVVVFAGGYNDPVSGLQAAALATFQAARAAMPNAAFFILGPWPGSGGQTRTIGATTLSKEAALLAAFNQFADPNSYFIPQENISVPWISGTGYQGATNSSGNSDIYIWTDGIHPSDLGYLAIGRRAAASIRQAIFDIKD